MDKVVQPSQIYARALYPLGYGCALWIPEPNNQLPTEYIREGIRIGDVGILRARGSFDFLFNVCCSANDPINTGYGVPEDFQMLQWNGLIRRTNDVFPPNNPVVSGGAETRDISVEVSASLPGLPIGAGAGFNIKFNKDRGALVIPPNGANSVDCQSTRTFREYAQQHARSWYNFVHESLGMEVENGSIYFITGFDKTDCWDNATFNSDAKERSLELIVMTGSLAGGDGRIRLSDSSVHASFSRRRSPPNNQYQNQALFIRGFRVSIRHPVATLLGRSSIDVISTDGASWRDAFGKKRPNHVTNRGHTSSSDGSMGSASPGSFSSVEKSFSAYGSIDVEDELSDDSESWGSGSNTSLEEDDFIPLSELYHPSKVINDYVLQSMSDVQLVVTHDEDWITLLNSQELEMPDDTLLIQRLRDMYQIQVENGCAVFCCAETSAPSVETQAAPMNVYTSNSCVTDRPIFSEANLTNQPPTSIDNYVEDMPQVPPIPRQRSLSILTYLPTAAMDVSRAQPRFQVDYLSHNWRDEDLWCSWKNVTGQKNEIADGTRLENASWRVWWKQKNELKTMSPETLNWCKDSDVNWLYGPLTTAVEWNSPPNPPQDHTERKPTLSQDRLNSSLPKHKPILKYRTISELLKRELSFSPVFSPTESDGEADAASSQDTFEMSSLPHTKSDTDIAQWRPEDTPSRIETSGSTGASITNSSTMALTNSRQSAPTCVSNSTSLTGSQGPPSRTTLRALASTTDSSSASRCGAFSEPPSVPAPKKKHISFNMFVEQCIAIDNPKTIKTGEEAYGPYDDLDGEEQDDGYDGDEQGGDGYDPDWDLNECLITDSDSDSGTDCEVVIQDEDEAGFNSVGIQASRTTKQTDSKKEPLWYKSKASIPIPSSPSEDSYASPLTSSSIKKRRPSIPTTSRRRRSGTDAGGLPRSNSDIATRPGSRKTPKPAPTREDLEKCARDLDLKIRALMLKYDRMVSIAPIAPTVLKTGEPHSFECPVHCPACDRFCIHSGATPAYGGWTDEDETLSEDGGFGGPSIRKDNRDSDNRRSSDSESSGTLVEYGYSPPPLGRYSSTSSSSGGEGKRLSGQDQDEGQGKMSSRLRDYWEEFGPQVTTTGDSESLYEAFH